MPITINLEEDPFYLEGKAKGIAEGKAKGIAEGEAKGKAEGKAEGVAEGEAKGMSQAKRNYVLSSFKNLHITPEQIASIVGDTPENVTAILKEEGLI